ncbi:MULTISPECIES: TolC family outer membrane protein [unclassified Novosphingobium]|uniref:TolC family outer membrane protein n=1 Tax=unclassified Novosphingobium TaxID=2644732 RepID=UPI001359354B|nr:MULTISPECIES: TolC family outer membrane protein [unclassified Novosphingobium]
MPMTMAAKIRTLRWLPLLLWAGMPAPVSAETLGEAMAIAYQHNPGVEASRASTRAAEERVRQAKAQFGPTLTADASYRYASRRVTQSSVTLLRQDGFTPQFSLSLDQPLFTFGRLSAQRNIAKAGYGASVADMLSSEQDLMANVVIAYAAVLRDEKLVGIAKENLSQLTETLDQINARYTARYATETDLQQTRNRIFSGQAQLELAQGNLQASRNTYRNILGHYPDALVPLPQLPPLPRSIEEAQAMGAVSSPVLASARFDLAAAKGRIAQTRGNARPYVGIQGSLARSPLTIENDDTRELSAQVQVGLTVPLYSGGLLSARIREAKQLADAATQQLEQTSRGVRENIASYWDQLSAARRALPAYTRAVTAAQSALDGAQQQQLAGQVTSLDVLDTARDLLTSRQARAQAEAQLYVQHALLLGAMGQLRAESFDPGTPAFDPDVYSSVPYAGLPTGPLVETLDSVAVDDNFKVSPVQFENDAEPGHAMAPEPEGQ